MNARIDPTFEVDIPLEFENIEEVLQLTRRAARKNLELLIYALHQAGDDTAKNAADIEVGRAFEAWQTADRACQSFASSEAAFLSTAGRDLLGREISSPEGGTIPAAGYEASARHMADAASRVNAVAAYAPSSAFFQAALNAVVKTDAAFAKVEHAASTKVAGFVKGLKAFGQRMSDFGKEIAAVPEKTRILAEKSSVSTKTATRAVVGRFLSRVRGAAAAVSATVEANIESAVSGAKSAHQSVKRNAFALLDDAADFADRQKERAKSAASTVDTHARVVVGAAGLAAGVAGGLLASMGRKAADGYRSQVVAVEASKAIRRATPR